MSTSRLKDQPRRGHHETLRAGAVRQTVELLVMLCLSVVLVRTFSAEAYVVPTGSMAPTLLGWHREIKCPSCLAVFVVGIEDEGQTGEAICPNCGKRGLDDGPSIECGGDRVLVEKFLFEFRRPRRWEVAVFHFPGEPSQAYVKRVVGLPGESIRISGGDVYVNDRIAESRCRKSERRECWSTKAGSSRRTPANTRVGCAGPMWQGELRSPGGDGKVCDSCMNPARILAPSGRTGCRTSTGIQGRAAMVR